MDLTDLLLHMEEITVTSVDALDSDSDPLYSMLPAPDHWQLRIELQDILARLPPTDRKLIFLRHQQGLTQAQAGQHLNLSQMQVSRREAALRALLRNALTE